MYQRILVPYDGSDTSSRGLDEAIRLAKAGGARLRLLHMTDVLLFASGFDSAEVYVSQVLPFMRQAGEKILLGGKARAESAGVPADTVLNDGITTPLFEAVNDQVQAWGADLIVIGTHGRRGVGRLLLGSDAEQIVRTASVPVLLVRAAEASSVATGTRAAAA